MRSRNFSTFARPTSSASVQQAAKHSAKQAATLLAALSALLPASLPGVASARLFAADGPRGDDHIVLAAPKDAVSGKDGRSGTRVDGVILNIADGQVKMRLRGDREESFPLARVMEYHTTWPAAFADAQRHYDAGEFAEALESFRRAAAGDSRAWVKRRMLAGAVACYREMDQPVRAVEGFLSLVQSDSQTPDFAVIPLAWTSHAGSTDLENRARQWLANAESPVARLLGSSWLLAVGQPGPAVATLERLTTERDTRVALLAETQLWRTRLPTLSANDATKWETMLLRLPESLRAGPYYTLGQAWARLDDADRAALAYLRVPVLYPEHRSLSAQAQTAAQAVMKKAGRELQ